MVRACVGRFLCMSGGWEITGSDVKLTQQGHIACFKKESLLASIVSPRESNVRTAVVGPVINTSSRTEFFIVIKASGATGSLVQGAGSMFRPGIASISGHVSVLRSSRVSLGNFFPSCW